MVRLNEIRENEVAITAPEPADAQLIFIGRISTPWTSRMETPRQGRPDGPICEIEIFEPWVQALAGIERFDRGARCARLVRKMQFVKLGGQPAPDVTAARDGRKIIEAVQQPALTQRLQHA